MKNTIMKNISKILLILFSILFLYGTSYASDDVNQKTHKILKPGFSFEGPFGVFDRSELRRGYQVYSEVCSSCHSIDQLSFRNLIQEGGPEFSEEETKRIASQYTISDRYDDYGELVERKRLLSDRFPSPFPNKKAAMFANNGSYPPDLSLIVKARVGGHNYIYSLLSGYEETIPEGLEVSGTLSYNPWYPGSAGIAMMQPLYDDLIEYSDGTPATIDQMAYDVTVFLSWVSEPELEARKKMGFVVIGFLIIFVFLMYLSTRRLWKEVH
mgnify:CR=1 FL=1